MVSNYHPEKYRPLRFLDKKANVRCSTLSFTKYQTILKTCICSTLTLNYNYSPNDESYKGKAEKTTEEGAAYGSLMYSGVKPRVVFFYALHRQTTCEHLDINRYEKRVFVRG